jgi:SpoVK/Ycf46/Vps4 family AAA+-type ATPase
MELSAQHIITSNQWTDIAPRRFTLEQLSGLQQQLKLRQFGIRDKEKRHQAGVCALFYGPLGTDKSIAVAVLGKESGLDVYRINLPGIVSKYIGETGKNIDQLFARAKDQRWILFFDEADALFDKNPETTDNGEKPNTNRELNYLLQRIEEYDGLVILSTNSKNNIDDAFIRRFYSVIHHFPVSSATNNTQ